MHNSLVPLRAAFSLTCSAIALASLVFSLLGCSSKRAPLDCATVATSYREACPREAGSEGEDVLEVLEQCEDLNAPTRCVAETANLQACIAADWGGLLGILCGDALFDEACEDQRDVLSDCVRSMPTPPEPACIGQSISCFDLPTGPECDAQLGCVTDGYSCDGTSTSCVSFASPGSCGAQRGCQWEVPEGAGTCIGRSASCFDLPTGFECDAQLGCVTDGSSCDGSSTSCSRFASSTTCGEQRGCQWEPPSTEAGECIGRSISCFDLPTGFECDAQLGCVTDGSSCDGSPASCYSFTSSTTCDAQRGCQWETGSP